MEYYVAHSLNCVKTLTIDLPHMAEMYLSKRVNDKSGGNSQIKHIIGNN